MASYVGVNHLARKVTSRYVGVNHLARKVKSGYVGVNNLARKYFGGDSWWQITMSTSATPPTTSAKGATLVSDSISEITFKPASNTSGGMMFKHKRLRADSSVGDAYADLYVAPYNGIYLNTGDVIKISCTSSSNTSSTSPISWIEIPADGSTPTWIYGSGSKSTGTGQPTSKSLALTNYSYTMKKKGVFCLRLAHWNYYYVKANEMSQVQITSLSVNGQKLI